jgi:transcriptional regulator with XRE-family HTH domain
MTIAKNIKAIRERYNMSQKDLSIIAGVSEQAVSAWETGIREPRMGAIQKIADHFGLKKSDIIDSKDIGSSLVLDVALTRQFAKLMADGNKENRNLKIEAIKNIANTKKTPEGFPEVTEKYGRYKIYVRRVSGNVRINIFHAGHAILGGTGVQWLLKQEKGKAADFTKIDSNEKSAALGK